MPIRAQIEAIVNSMLVIEPAVDGDPLTAPSFLYGTTNELNLLADDAAFPCIMLYALQPIDLAPGVNGSVGDKISILLAICFKTDFDQFSAQDEPNVILAVKWAKIFLLKLAAYREGPGRYFRIKNGQKAQAKPFYNKNDLNVCVSGCTLAVTLETMYDDNLNQYLG